MAIGDELFSLLGLVPSRDRAGIARGTMADEAKASISANSGNAEGRALIDQGARPPDFELPADIPTAYAAGKQRAAPSVIPDVMPPAPSERVVASGPAAAPPPAVVRNSDIILQAMQRQAQAARMQQIIGSIGMIVNGAFNRNPDSQASTKASLAGMMGGGGGAGAGGGDVGTLAKLLEMRDAETLELKTVPELQRMFGWSEDRARAAFRSGEYKNWLNPAAIKTLEADKQAARSREELLTPEVVKEVAKRTGQPEAVVRADARAGKIDQKTLVDIAKDQAATGKIKSETTELDLKNIGSAAENMAWLTMRADPAAWAAKHGLDTNLATAMAENKKAYLDFLEKSHPTASTLGQEWNLINRAREAENAKRPEGTAAKPYVPPETVKSIMAPAKPDKIADSLGDQYLDRLNKQVRPAEADNAGQLKDLQDMWFKGLKSGSRFSETALDVRKSLATALGMPIPDDVAKTELFFNRLKEGVLGRTHQLQGQLSNADREFLESLSGNMRITPQTIERLLYLREKQNNFAIAQFNRDVDKDSDTHATLKGVPRGSFAAPNKFMRAEVERQLPGVIEGLVKRGTADDPSNRAMFEERMGPGVYDQLVAEAKSKLRK